jgi:acetyltransferase-like isoleucine patch superfamily enzyme
MNLIYLWSKILRKLRGAAIKNSSIHKTSKIEAGSHIVNTFMDKHSFCGYDCEITNCEIGSFTSIANGVVIGGGMHPIGWVGTSPVFYEGRDSVKAKFSEFKRDKVKTTLIGHDVWIGRNALIKQGVTIGNGAVIGMGSIVTKDVFPYSIIGGNPAKIIRMRFDSNIIDELIKSEWWNIDEEILSKCAPNIKDPKLFLKSIESYK